MKQWKWLAELRLFWFQCMYSSIIDNVVRFGKGYAFCVSLVGFIIGVCAWVAWILLWLRHEVLQLLSWFCSHIVPFSAAGVLGVGGLVWTAIMIRRSVRGFRAQFSSKDDMICFKDRRDKDRFAEDWCEIASNGDALGFEVHKILNGKAFVDFYSYSKKLNNSLVAGLSIPYNVKRFGTTRCWNAINKNLKEALLRLDLKQRSNGYQGFTNESKVAFVSDGFFCGKKTKNGTPAPIDIAKTCYYATYLTNETYRDLVYSGEDLANKKGISEWMSPFGIEGRKLQPFSAAKSYHIGVNTLGITRDGRVCIWRQRRGQRSNNLMAPTGSGSMDWSDIKHASNKNFNKAIIYGAERELKEESFSQDTRDKLIELSKEGKVLESRIIGMYRWGSLGGLPGFVLVTMIPMKYNEIELPGLSGCGGTGECVRDSAKMQWLGGGDVYSIQKILNVPQKNVENWRDECAAEVDRYMNNNSSDLSVPLYVCLKFFAEALRTSQELGDWINNRIEN